MTPLFLTIYYLMLANRKNLFARLTTDGYRVKILHQIGKCAVAHVTPTEDSRTPYYVARWRQHYAEFGHMSEAIPALWQLRRMDNAEVKRDRETLTFIDFRDSLPEYKPDVVRAFFASHGLNVEGHYTRADIRRAITTAKLPKYQKYLSWVNRAAPELNE